MGTALVPLSPRSIVRLGVLLYRIRAKKFRIGLSGPYERGTHRSLPTDERAGMHSSHGRGVEIWPKEVREGNVGIDDGRLLVEDRTGDIPRIVRRVGHSTSRRRIVPPRQLDTRFRRTSRIRPTDLSVDGGRYGTSRLRPTVLPMHPAAA